VADKLGIDLVWFGVLLAVNMQTSFMHPPFGFALFYLRSVAPTDDYTDKLTKKPIGKVTTGQIYMGAIPFVIIQLVMVGLIIGFPGLVSHGEAAAAMDDDKVMEQLRLQEQPQTAPEPSFAPESGAAPDPAASGAEAPAGDNDDAFKALQDAIQKDDQKK
jgi:hypothetical protein